MPKQDKKEYSSAVHTFAPVFDGESKVLILGSFPSVKSRETNFYYGNPQNRFWRLLAQLFDEPCPQSVSDKTGFLLAHHLAVWDVIASCEIIGSSDSSIRNVVANDLSRILKGNENIEIFANGGTAGRLYQKYQEPRTGKPITVLPSTSPANAAYSPERLRGRWEEILRFVG